MTLDDRLLVAAVLDRLLAGGTTYDPADAGLLARLVPVERARPNFGLDLLGRREGGETRGHAAGVGDVAVPEDGTTVRREIGIGGRTAHRVGGFKVEHTPGEILIVDALDTAADTDADDRRALLVYRGGGRRPVGLYLYAPRRLRLPLGFAEMSLALEAWKAWKRPVPSSRPHGA